MRLWLHWRKYDIQRWIANLSPRWLVYRCGARIYRQASVTGRLGNGDPWFIIGQYGNDANLYGTRKSSRKMDDRCYL